MAARLKPFLNRLRRILRPVENRLGDLIARGQILVVSESSGVNQCRLVLRLLDRMSSEGEDPTVLATAKAEVQALLGRQLAELTHARVSTEEQVAIARKIGTVETLAAEAAA